MPPRISPHRIAQPTTCQCFRTRPAPIIDSSTRSFHSSPSNAGRTKYREDMFKWLAGPGKVFKSPLPNSTNYLSAYDRQGTLLRTKRKDDQRQPEDGIEKDLDQDEEMLQARDLEELGEAEAYQAADRRAKARADKQDLDDRGGVPKERPSDLRPYPLNPYFQSQSVLSEELRERIYELVVEEGLDIKSVSAAFGVDIRRVAAVARLKSLEKQWVQEGKQLATPYSKAVLAMLPQTPYRPQLQSPPPHEGINDIPVHPATRQQLFISSSESRDFTRADAAKAFSNKLLPADERIAHPELVEITKWELAGHDQETRRRMMNAKDTEAAVKREEKERKQKEWEAKSQVTVAGRRWDFKFQDFSAEKVGKDGRGRGAVGLRYGMPHNDRKRGLYKLPAKVE